VLGGVIGSTPGSAHQPSEEQLTIAPFPCLHIWRSSNFAPYTTEVDGHHSVKIFSRSVSGFRNNILNASVIVGGI
jgi:hypothetical protein